MMIPGKLSGSALNLTVRFNECIQEPDFMGSERFFLHTQAYQDFCRFPSRCNMGGSVQAMLLRHLRSHLKFVSGHQEWQQKWKSITPQREKKKKDHFIA